MRGLLRILCACVLSISCHSVLAGPITGEISYVGGVVAEDGSGNTATLGEATFLDFFDLGYVVSGLGDFSPLSGTMVNLHDFSINPFNSPSTVWTGGSFEFSLTSITIPIQTDSPFSQLFLSGNGLFTGTGYDDTSGFWTLSAQTASGGTIVAFSATSVVAPSVPEPGALILIAMGLLGLGLIRRRKLTT